MNNILKNCSCYLVGSMQYEDGQGWRKSVTESLSNIPIKCFNPYEKPFLQGFSEDNDTRDHLEILMQTEQYDTVSEHMREVRSYDLNLVDRSDFIFAYFNPKIPSFGSCEEIYWANRLKKPMFVIIEGGKKQTPLWLMGTIPHYFIYDSFQTALDDIHRINNGELLIDNKRWRLLKEEYR